MKLSVYATRQALRVVE